VGQPEIVRARFLAPLVKARGFGMTPCKGSAKLALNGMTRILWNAFNLIF
jgi:hypothetical protein